jgi:hypothetical protein
MLQKLLQKIEMEEIQEEPSSIDEASNKDDSVIKSLAERGRVLKHQRSVQLGKSSFQTPLV